MSLFTEGKLFKKAGEGSGGGGGDQHNLGWYATQSALETAHPTATAGDWAIVGSTDTVWVWDTDDSAWVDSDQKGQVTSVNNKTGDVTIGANDVLPSQTGNTGKFLTTDGTDASWSDKPLVNTATGNNSITLLGTPITEQYGVNIGYGSVSSKGYSVAIGYEATTTATNQVAIGYQAKIIGSRTYNAVVIGRDATSKGLNNTYTYGTIAIGNGATIGDGLNAINGAMQFGMGTNLESGTVCFALSVNGSDWTNYKLLDSDGTIPTARLTKVNSTITLTAAGWSSNTQTVNVTGMTATGVVFVSPDPTDQADYTSAGIICSAQAAGTLTFTCDTTPANDIDVVVVML